MNRTRTSVTHPLRIDDVVLPNEAMLGLSLCPGKKQACAMTGAWDRDLAADLRLIHDWGGATVITLLEPFELDDLGVANLGQEVAAQGMQWLHLPIVNDTTPNLNFMEAWRDNRQAVHNVFDHGGKVFIHCMGGIGRTSVLAAMILVERGIAPQEAVKMISDARENSFCIPEQSLFILAYQPSRSAGQTRPLPVLNPLHL